jgi:hypothetical protein
MVIFQILSEIPIILKIDLFLTNNSSGTGKMFE